MKEAARIQNDYLYHVRGAKFDKLEEKDPYIEDEDQVATRVGYLYKIWNLGKDLNICIRCQVHSTLEVSQERLNCFALLEWSEKRQTWGKELDNSAAICLTKEIADNATKFCRWTVQSLLAGV